jgi:hypothetical protein
MRRMGTDSVAYLDRIDQQVREAQRQYQAGLISLQEAIRLALS